MKYEIKDLTPLTIEEAKEYVNPIVGEEGPVCNVLGWDNDDSKARKCQLIAINKRAPYPFYTVIGDGHNPIVIASPNITPIPEPVKVYWDAPRLMAWPGGYRGVNDRKRINRILWASDECVVKTGIQGTFDREEFCEEYQAIDAEGKAHDLWEVKS